MARMVKHEASGPMIIELGGEKKAICACGLTNNSPLCDGSHAKTRDEEPEKLYRYDGDNRTEVNE